MARVEMGKSKPKKEEPAKKAKPPLMSSRTMALAGMFLVLMAIVAYVWMPERTPEAPPPETILGPDGQPMPIPVPTPTDPANLPPGSTEEVRPS